MSRTLTTTQVRRVCPGLPELAWRRVLKAAGADPDSADKLLDPGQTLAAWTADLLFRAPLPDREQARLVWDEFLPELLAHGRCLDPDGAVPAEAPVAFLVLLDRAHACISGRAGLLELATGRIVDSLPQPPLEAVSYNLTALYARQSARASTEARRHATRAPQDPHAQGSLGRS